MSRNLILTLFALVLAMLICGGLLFGMMFGSYFA